MMHRGYVPRILRAKVSLYRLPEVRWGWGGGWGGIREKVGHKQLFGQKDGHKGKIGLDVTDEMRDIRAFLNVPETKGIPQMSKISPAAPKTICESYP